MHECYIYIIPETLPPLTLPVSFPIPSQTLCLFYNYHFCICMGTWPAEFIQSCSYVWSLGPSTCDWIELLPGEDRSSLSLPPPRWGPVALACCLLSPCRSCLGNQTVEISCHIPFFRASCMLRRYCLETGILVLWFFQSLYSIKPRET